MEIAFTILKLLRRLVTDPVITGIVGWLGFFATVGGFAIAIDQIRRTKKAAEAAKTATEDLARTIFSRERLLELATAISHIDSARERIAQGQFEVALVFVDFALAQCIHIHELLGEHQKKKFYKCVLRLRKLAETLSAARQSNTEAEVAGTAALEARSITGVMNEMSVKLRYSYGDEGI